jgi:hypothetical protein
MEQKTRGNSTNFIVAMLTIGFTFITAQGINIPDGAAIEVVQAFQTMNTVTILMTITPLLLVPIIKLIEKAKTGFEWTFLKSTNFIFQIVSAIMLLLEMFNVLPVDSGKALAGTLQSMNVAYHVYKDGI